MATSSGASSQQALPKRLLSAAIGLPLLGLVLWLGGPLFVAVALAATVIALYEALSLLRRAGWAPLVNEGIACGAVIVLATAALDWPFGAVTVGAAAAAVFLSALWKTRSLEAVGIWVLTVLGVAYVALPLASVVALRPAPSGLDWLLVAFLATFATDTGAYAVGRLIGRRRMAPSVSPGKTWEGAVGGVVAGVGATFGLALLLDVPLSGAAAAGVGFAIALVAQAGDLLESKLKRMAGAKDSGRLIPGHGGLLDRLDSLVGVFPLIYYVSRIWPS